MLLCHALIFFFFFFFFFSFFFVLFFSLLFLLFLFLYGFENVSPVISRDEIEQVLKFINSIKQHYCLFQIFFAFQLTCMNVDSEISLLVLNNLLSTRGWDEGGDGIYGPPRPLLY